MAKLNVEFDSVSKTLAVFVDGQPVGDCQYLTFYKYEDCCSMEMSLKPEKFDGITSHLRVCASNDPKIEGQPEDFSEDKSLVKHAVALTKKRWW